MTNPNSSACRAAAVLSTATPRQVEAALALDHELAWYFEYAAAALRRGSVSLLPQHAVIGALAWSTPEAMRQQAGALARTVEGCLEALADRHASVLRAAYTPRRWPKNVETALETLAPIVVRLALASDPWLRSTRGGLENAAAARLAAGKGMNLDRLKAEARRLFGSAVAAYAEARRL